MPVPIALFVYSRPEHLMQTLHALEQNEMASDSDLYIFADGPKENSNSELLNRISKVRSLIRQKWNFKNIIIEEKDYNYGLANSIIEGVTKLVNEYGKVIVLEDDLITSQGFLKYMNEALDIYLNEQKVMQISGFQFPVNFPKKTPETFFLPLTTSWGWATWKRAWDLFDLNATGWEELKIREDLRHKFNLDGAYPFYDMLQAQMEYKTLDSWAIRWWWSVFKQNGLVLYPYLSFIENVGFDDFATNTRSDNWYSNKKLKRNLENTYTDTIVFHVEYFDMIILLLKNKNLNSNPIKNSIFFKICNFLNFNKNKKLND